MRLLNCRRCCVACSLQGWWQTCCEGVKVTMAGDVSGASQFYVFVGVMAFLYSLGAVLLYIFADDKYRQLDYLPKIVSLEILLRGFSITFSIDFNVTNARHSMALAPVSVYLRVV